MSDSKPTSTYAGYRMTIDQLADAREAVETWASHAYARTNPSLYRDIRHMCTLAQGMWYKTSNNGSHQ